MATHTLFIYIYIYVCTYFIVGKGPAALKSHNKEKIKHENTVIGMESCTSQVSCRMHPSVVPIKMQLANDSS